MNYVRNKDKELDELVDKVRKYLPGFYPGCTIEVMSTSWYRDKHKGKTFISTSEKEDMKHLYYYWKDNKGTGAIDPFNKYGINYLPEDIKVVNPLSFYDDINPSSMTSKQLEEELSVYFPGFYIGCTMEITDQCPDKSKVGKRFVTSDIHNRLQSTVRDIRNGGVFILDPNNTYHINYRNPSWLKVVDPVNNKSKPQEIKVFGEYSIGQIVVSLSTYYDNRKTNQLFKVLPNSDAYCLYYHELISSCDPSDWRAATKEETDYYHFKSSAGFLEIMADDVNKVEVKEQTIICHQPTSWDVNYSFNCTDVPETKVTTEEKAKPIFISDFITTQLKSKKRRVKLSIK